MSQASPLRRRKRKPYVVNADDPDAMAKCDGCGFWVNHSHLRPHMQYRGGNVPVRDGFMVCATCDDVPNQYFKKQVLSPDPVPVKNPRPDQNVTNPWFQDAPVPSPVAAPFRVTSEGWVRITGDMNYRITSGYAL